MKIKPSIGQIVTTTERVEAYYSNYGGNDYMVFAPGDIGVIMSVKVPCVSHTPGNPYTFNCVDFYKYGQINRVALWDKQVVQTPDAYLTDDLLAHSHAMFETFVRIDQLSTAERDAINERIKPSTQEHK